jgi:peptidoglycan/xylan/chitin deacetylase (PgdA/CDA1 family)|tara:strand:+ start:1269 stop:2126 length:858 start_codon:yes stop_codon:yes gene_type:complete
MKYFCFRFDVDTPKCVKVGIPNLISLSKELDVPFTFFINMGHGTSRWSFIKNLSFFNSTTTKHSAQKLSNLNKLGLSDYLKMAILNPQVGNSYPNIIQSLENSGHEVGLHGGSNHGEWQYESDTWNKKKFLDEIVSSLNSLNKCINNKPTGFSSPGWKSSNELHQILESLGFLYIADAHGEHHEKITIAQNSSKLLQIPTNILGEPGGVAYLENLRAQRMNDSSILKNFSKRLDGKTLAVIYDHPYYAGIKELPILKAMIKIVQARGFQIVTLKTIAEKSHLQAV